ncbi:MAG: leucine--tRNA ligase [Patescibacteria group bacterium]|nr:leucine--tRNA ligase [Patescibacteria group bacterium]
MEKYNHKKIEKKWQKIWEDNQVVNIDKDNTKKKFYMLDMFPYPSGDGLHMGHTESYTASDVFTRFKTMQGFNVLHPQGFDAFGLPAENYAIKTGIAPEISTAKNIDNYIKQMKLLGLRYDFDEKVVTYEPEYYKWTQWLFIKFFENDLVYKKTSKINWCESCQTGIANEQVVGGECERCGTQIVQKEIPSWFFKITEFADDLINDLDIVDWPEHTKKNQKNWIGKSEGAKIVFKVQSPKSKVEKEIEVFTTRPDTLFGATYMVLAPEHQLVQDLKEKVENWEEVEKYIKEAQSKTEMDRIEAKDKTGVKLEGIFATNPANKEEIPIFIADYVLSGYGTGAIMAVPAHDERDFEFATKFGLDIREVISGGDIKEESYSGDGVLVNSTQFDGMTSEEAKQKITEFVEGESTSNYRLRDWSMSRQRYWGCPIPIVYSPEGEAKLIPEEHLPWLLPTDVDFIPSGKSPLEKSKELRERTEKIFGKGWTPEFDTMDTFVDSSWYFLRYPDVHNEREFCSEDRKKWLPVDLYIGGAEHTYMHLLFSRFFVKAMNKIGLLDFNEPFLKLRHQGMILDGEGKKMSKSKGNVVNPNEMVERFGADSVRTYILFATPLEDEVMWNEDNIVGVYRFLEKVFYQREKLEETTSQEVQNVLHKTIRKVGNDINGLKYNTAVSEMMKFMKVVKTSQISQKDFEKFLRILSPFTPHITEEIWNSLGHDSSIHLEKWPAYDEKLAKDDLYTVAVQINGKVRAEIEVRDEDSEKEVKDKVLSDLRVQKWLDGQEVKKSIYIKNKIFNIVI